MTHINAARIIQHLSERWENMPDARQASNALKYDMKDAAFRTAATLAAPAQIRDRNAPGAISIHGVNFTAGMKVLVDGTVALTGVQLLSPDTLNATLPAGLSLGYHDLWWRTPKVSGAC